MNREELKLLEDDEIVSLPAKELKRTLSVALELYQERRLTGDNQRDMAQALQHAVDEAVVLEETPAFPSDVLAVLDKLMDIGGGAVLIRRRTDADIRIRSLSENGIIIETPGDLYCGDTLWEALCTASNILNIPLET